MGIIATRESVPEDYIEQIEKELERGLVRAQGKWAQGKWCRKIKKNNIIIVC